MASASGHTSGNHGNSLCGSAAWSEAVCPPAHPRKLLLADGKHPAAMGLARTLSELGYAVMGPAPNGREAIELCRCDKPDMALLDARIGEIGLLDATDILFSEMSTPVIIFSDVADEQCINAGSRIGAFNYLLMPISPVQLRVAISVAWSRYLAWNTQDAEIRKLRTRLENRKIIEQAKWILVLNKGVTEPQAMKMIQMQSRNTRTPLVDVARDMIESHNPTAS